MSENKINDSIDILTLAQRMHDELVEKGQHEYERVLEEAGITADRLLSEAQAESRIIRDNTDREARELLTNANQQTENILLELQIKKESLTEEISRLQAFEANYRQSLEELIANAQNTLGNKLIEDDSVEENQEEHLSTHEENVEEDDELTENDLVWANDMAETGETHVSHETTEKSFDNETVEEQVENIVEYDNDEEGDIGEENVGGASDSTDAEEGFYSGAGENNDAIEGVTVEEEHPDYSDSSIEETVEKVSENNIWEEPELIENDVVDEGSDTNGVEEAEEESVTPFYTDGIFNTENEPEENRF